METTRITDTANRWFAPIWEIYRTSFPLNEQRTLEHQETALLSSAFHFDCYHDGEQLIGFTGIWEFDDYLYVEHFAINPDLRSGGWGSKILSEIQKSTKKTIILEIDEVIDEISSRREQFYMRLGFVPNPYKHPLHRYQTEYHTDALLQIMTYPAAIDRAMYERFNSDLAETVMKR